MHVRHADHRLAAGLRRGDADAIRRLHAEYGSTVLGFAALDISVEPPDGDPAHSSRSVLRAPLGRL